MPRLQTVIPADLKAWLKSQARKEGRTLSQYVKRVLELNRESVKLTLKNALPPKPADPAPPTGASDASDRPHGGTDGHGESAG